MGHFLKLIFALALMLSVSHAKAGYAALSAPANVAAASSGGGYVTRAATAIVGAAFNSGLTTQVAGKAVTVPATFRLAANAGQFAVSALRISPAALIGGAIASYLLTKGISMLNGEPVMAPPDSCASNCFTFRAQAPNAWYLSGPTSTAALAAAAAYAAPIYGAGQVTYQYVDEIQYDMRSCPTCEYVRYNYIKSPRAPDTATAPVDDAKWAEIAALPLPDPVASELTQKGVALPLQVPEVAPVPQTVPLSDPYVDPVTGKRYRDVATITPQPSDPMKAKVDINKQEVDASGNPISDPLRPGNPLPPESPKDVCEKNPDAAMCKELDEPEDSDIQNHDINLSVVPLPGFGPTSASCPAPYSLFVRGGQTITWEWTKFCDFSLGIRPLVIGFAWIAAFMIVAGVARRES